MKNEIPTIALMAILCSSPTFAATYTLNGGTKDAPLDAMDPSSWGATEAINSGDSLYIDGAAEMSGDGQTLTSWRHYFRNNAYFAMTGTNSTFSNVSTSGNANNLQFGEGNNHAITVKVLGSGNTFVTESSGGSFKMGGWGSTTGENLIEISSNNQTARNKLNISGINGFIALSTDAGSVSKNTITVGDYSDLNVKVQFRVGGENSGTVRAGENTVQMVGRDSVLTVDHNGEFRIGTTSSTAVTGGTAKVVVGGSNNAFIVSNASNGFNIFSSGAVSGGENAFVVEGAGNTVDIKKTVIVGTVNMTSDAKARFAVSGDTHSLTLASLTLAGYGEFTMEGSGHTFSTASQTFGNYSTALVSGSNNTLNTTADITLNNNATYELLGSGNKLTLANASFAVNASGKLSIRGGNSIASTNFFANGADSVLEIFATANQDEVLSFGNSTFAGKLIVDFSEYVLQDLVGGDDIKLISATGDKSAWVTAMNEGRFSVVGSEEYSFSWVGNTLMLHVDSLTIPEPSSYAAVFGTLAFAFCAYRRKRG